MGYFVKKNLIGLISVALSFAILSVFVAASGGFRHLYRAVTGLNNLWFFAGVCCVFLYWALDGLVLHMFIRLLYRKQSFYKSVKASLIGLLYNALTPFAIGGQPMQLLELTRNGISVGDAGSFITVKTIIYQLCMTLYAVVSVIFSFRFFHRTIANLLWFATAGVVVNVLFILCVYAAATNKSVVIKFYGFMLRLVSGIKLFKNPGRYTEKIMHQIDMFHESSSIINRDKKTILLSLVVTTLQLTAFYCIPFCIYRSFNLSGSTYLYIICAVAIIAMITAFVPVPGGSGAAEGSFYLFFTIFFTKASIFPAMFIWRFITYYLCIIAGALISLTDIVRCRPD